MKLEIRASHPTGYQALFSTRRVPKGERGMLSEGRRGQSIMWLHVQFPSLPGMGVGLPFTPTACLDFPMRKEALAHTI